MNLSEISELITLVRRLFRGDIEIVETNRSGRVVRRYAIVQKGEQQ